MLFSHLAAVTAPAFYGFTDGTTVWVISVSTQGIEPFVADYMDPLNLGIGSALNPFGIRAALSESEYLTVRLRG